jgi:phospholipid/cholesterol/gamma-HCH transport system substrate-binding protein
MDKQSLSVQYKVGLFIGAGLLALMSAILLLGGGKAVFTRFFLLHTTFTEVQGLFPGSVVSLAGVPVGNIKAIEFIAKENRLDVILKINEEFQTRIVEGTTAEVRTQGALGDKFIYLKPGPPGGKILPAESVLEGIDSDYLKLLTDREDGVARVIDLIKEMHILVANLNQNGRSAEMMRNLTDASANLKTALANLNALSGDIRGQIPENQKLKAALIHLGEIMEKVDNGKGTLGLLINDPSVYQNLKSYLGGSPRNRYMKEMIRETIQRSENP